VKVVGRTVEVLAAAVIPPSGARVGVTKSVLDVLQRSARPQRPGGVECWRPCGVTPAYSPASRQGRPSCAYASR